MKKTIASAFTALALLTSASVMAQGTHEGEHPQHGGILAEVKGIQYELVAKPDVVTIYVSDHGKIVSTKGATGKLTLLNGSEKTDVALIPVGENKLEAKGSFKVDGGAKAVAVVTLAGKPAQSVRFAMK